MSRRLEEENRTMDEALRQYQQDLLRARLSRRRFMTMAAFGGASAFLAACSGSTTPAPSASASAGAPPPAAPPAPHTRAERLGLGGGAQHGALDGSVDRSLRGSEPGRQLRARVGAVPVQLVR